MSQTILNHANDVELAAAVEENLYALFRSMLVLPGSEIMENDKVSFHHAFPTNPMFKGVWRARLLAGEVDEAIDAAVAWFGQRKVPYFFWWIDSQTRPANLVEYLLKRGFDGNLEGDPGMAMDLLTLQESIHTPDKFKIVQAADQKTLNDWRDVFATAFEMPLSGGQAWVDATLSVKEVNVPWQMYVGYVDDKPVATSMLFKGAGVAGIYGIGTLPEMRHRGMGAAITLRPLLDARQQGYRFAVLFATRMGYPLYQRLGFRAVPCKIGIYVLEQEPS